LLLSQYAKLAKISDNSGIYRDKSVAVSAILIVIVEPPERRDGRTLLSQSEAFRAEAMQSAAFTGGCSTADRIT